MALIFSLIFLVSAAISAAASSGYGFSVELIHRDSPKSPMYNPSETHYHRLANTLRRSIRRNTAAAPADTAEAPMYNNRGDYLMKVSLGTPPFPILAIADTGSDVIWTQCQPCPDCYEQNAPMFDPRKSATYKIVPCSSPICSFAGQDRSCSNRSECLYSISYGDDSHSEGDLAVDTVTMGSTSGRPVAIPRTVFGCGHDNDGTFNANVSGIVGLGQGPASLVSQMGAAAGGKFSYCLAPIGASLESSKLNFGSNAIVSGSEAVSTPIYTSNKPYNTFYSLNLEAINVGEKRFDFPSSSPLGQGENIIIDSGTTLTLLPPNFYTDVATAISNSVNLQRTDDPNEFLENCFETRTDDFEAPAITVHFEGADVPLQRENVFVRVADNVVCLAFGVQDDGISIYGNIAQNNFLVGYDIKNKFVSFKPANCAAM